MKLRVSFVMTTVLTVPEILAENAQGGVPAVVKEVTEQLKKDMVLKYGKDIMVSVEVIDG